MSTEKQQAQEAWEQGYREGRGLVASMGIAAGSSSATAASDVALIRDLPLAKDTLDGLVAARFRIEQLSDKALDVLEASLTPGAPRDLEFQDVPGEALRSFIARERLTRAAKAEKSKLRTDRVITIVGFAVTILAVILAALLG